MEWDKQVVAVMDRVLSALAERIDGAQGSLVEWRLRAFSTPIDGITGAPCSLREKQGGVLSARTGQQGRALSTQYPAQCSVLSAPCAHRTREQRSLSTPMKRDAQSLQSLLNRPHHPHLRH